MLALGVFFFLLWSAFLIGALWLVARVFLSGPSLAIYDQPAGQIVGSSSAGGGEDQEVLRRLREIQRRMRAGRRSLSLTTLRAATDAAFSELAAPLADSNCELRNVLANGVKAEWVLAANADPARRLLYIHGGAFIAGSPHSHRAITTALSGLAGIAVLAIDYRLQPDNSRRAGLADCQRAYRWLLENGPTGATPAADCYVAGDSAGGNFALVLIASIRDLGLRQVDAALAFSPSTDATLTSPSLRAHILSDPFLGPTLGRIARMPRWILAYVTVATTQLLPQHPTVSPVYGQLSALPPTLIQASTSEMLLDDARRYVNKARAANTPAELALWADQIHVWQLFPAVSSAARDALAHAAAFLNAHRHDRAGHQPTTQT